MSRRTSSGNSIFLSLCLLLKRKITSCAPIFQVEESRYPYIVALKDKIFGNLTCGGSLIAQDTILTAAHCIIGSEDFFPFFFTAVIGRHDITSADGEEASLDHVVVHPNYDNKTFIDDFALIFLSQPTSLVTEYALLNSDKSLPASGDSVLTMGWGDTSEDAETPIFSDVLLETDLLVMSNEDCLTTIENFYDSNGFDDFLAFLAGINLVEFDSDSMICTLEPGNGACSRDSGKFKFD